VLTEERPAETEPEEPPEPPRRRSFSTAALVTLIGAMLAAGLSATSLVYQIWPGLKPDPKEKVGATIENLALDRNVTRAEFFARSGLPATPGEDPNANGNVFYIRAEVEGFKRSEVRFRWFTYDAYVSTRLKGLRSNDLETPVFKPQAPINTQIAQVWVPNPKRSGKFFVRFELWAGNVLLAFADSKRFETINIPDLGPALGGGAGGPTKATQQRRQS
jgi:hypothetical protein